MLKDTGFSSCADDINSYTNGSTLNEIIETLESYSFRLCQWFKDNQIKTNKYNRYL